jgi:hypothetical protein
MHAHDVVQISTLKKHLLEKQFPSADNNNTSKLIVSPAQNGAIFTANLTRAVHIISIKMKQSAMWEKRVSGRG